MNHQKKNFQLGRKRNQLKLHKEVVVHLLYDFYLPTDMKAESSSYETAWLTCFGRESVTDRGFDSHTRSTEEFAKPD